MYSDTLQHRVCVCMR